MVVGILTLDYDPHDFPLTPDQAEPTITGMNGLDTDAIIRAALDLADR